MHNQTLNNDDCKSNSSTPPQKMEAIKTDYHIINPNLVDEESPPILPIHRNRLSLSRSTWCLIFLSAIIAVFAVFAIKHYAPNYMRKEVIPAIHWLVETCSQKELAAIVFGAIALLPILLLPTVPFKWIVGMAFGYGVGFLLIMCAVSVAVTLPYIIAYHLFLHRIEKWLEKYPEKAAIVRLAGDGDWLHQFKAVVLLRLTPFPYVVLNYVAFVTGVKYTPYLVGSLVGMIPEVIFAIYSGRLFRRVAEAMEDHTHVSKFQMAFDGVGFCLSAVATIVIGFYSKRKLEQLQGAEQQERQ